MTVLFWQLKRFPEGKVTGPIRAVVLGSLLLANSVLGQTANFQDLFANRETVTNASGQITGNNTNATVELNEPQIGGKPPSHSVWINWTAPANGVATFYTYGSTFDTLLSAFFFNSTNDTTLDKLHEAARNDDDGPTFAPQSKIQFGALAGQTYQIAVAGYQGAVGNIVLGWSLVTVPTPPPIVVSTPNDRALQIGVPVTLSVDVQLTSQVSVEWHFNGQELDVKTNVLVIPSLQASNVGRYTLEIKINSGPNFETTPTELQINSEGQTNSLAQDKLLDSPRSGFVGEDDGTNHLLVRVAGGTVTRKALFGVVRGYNGSQVFNTTYATSDPNEPPHCGTLGGASYWLQYEPPTNGTITLDTIGSTYDTVMEAYTYNGTLTNYSNLISLACDNDGVSPQGPSRVQFPVYKTRQYLIVVDGVNGARGTAYLNYSLNTNLLPRAPMATTQSQGMVVAAGTDPFIAPPVQASPPLLCFWSKDGINLVTNNSPTLQLHHVSQADAGVYTLIVTNDLGIITNTTYLRVVIPTQCVLSNTGPGYELSWTTATNQTYTLEQAGSVLGPWVPATNSFAGDGQKITVPVGGSGMKFFRVRIE